MKRLFTKYGLYLICFVALNFIDVVRFTQPGNIWKTAANCTGFVVMIMIFSQIPLKQFLKPVYYIYTAVCIALVGTLYWHWQGHMGEYYFGQIATAIMNFWWLGLVAKYWFNEVFEKKNRSLQISIVGWCWIILMIWMIFSRADRWWPLWYLLMFGSFYLVRFSKEDKRAFLDAMIDGTILWFFILQTFAYLFRPYDTVRYSGAYANCNVAALHYLIVYCMILFKLHRLHIRNAKKGWKVFYFIGAAGMLGFQFLTICRTIWICAVLVTICYGLFVVKKAWKDTWVKLCVRGFVLVLTAVITFPVVFLTVRWLPTIHPHPIWYEGEWYEFKVQAWDDAHSSKYVEMDEFLDEALGRILKAFGIKNPLVMTSYAMENGMTILPEPEEGWLEDGLSGRKTIFRTYLENSTWFGQPEEAGVYRFEESKYTMWHAQNLWVQVTYDFGYPAGILLIILTVLVLYKSVKKMRTIDNDEYAMMPLILSIVYFCYGLMEVTWEPGQLIFTLVFLVMHPQIVETTVMDSRTVEETTNEKVS